MLLETSRFGALEVDPNTVIIFTQPILGFQEYRRFILLPGPSSFLKWLQSTDSGDLAFILLDPKSVVPDYQVNLGEQELAELAATRVEDLDIYTLVVVPQDPSRIRTNLKAPILLNMKHRLGKQTILDNSDYPIQYYLSKSAERVASKGVPNARTDA
ncbi:MAG TPA: flagellar assembly protein FliW [Candidatus Hydrogenedentes bacterium]|nr:flagellar assembly protein FliW [Candidatus Hydrogenedentota bacterium]HOL75462.1 flagellar assembly protein FliW [Candidatus Hydrogenedentota bacterium]HPO84971.1 flagellar assembly protein FliW [Candidatus Hydrogenedentota bacterium]